MEDLRKHLAGVVRAARASGTDVRRILRLTNAHGVPAGYDDSRDIAPLLALVDDPRNALAPAPAGFDAAPRHGAAAPRRIFFRPFTFANDDGTKAVTISLAEVNKQITQANECWSDAHIEFALDPFTNLSPIRSTLINLDGTLPANTPMTDAKADPTNKLSDTQKHFDARTTFARAFRGRIVTLYTYGTFYAWDATLKKWVRVPRAGGQSWLDYEFVLMAAVNGGFDNLFAHEAGHYFHLPHTHHDERMPTTATEAAEFIRRYVEEEGGQRSTGDRCFDGDTDEGVLDTMPDPSTLFDDTKNGSPDSQFVSVDVTFSDTTTKSYLLAPDRTNIMSYFKHFTTFRHTLSLFQVSRVNASLAAGGNRAHLLQFPVTDGWTWWMYLGGQTPDAPAVVEPSENTIDVYVRGMDGALWQKWWTGSNWEPSAEGWHRHNDGFVLASGPSVVSLGEGFRDVYARGADGAVYHKFYENQQWSQWFSLGGGIQGRPAVVKPTPSTIDIYVWGNDGALWQKWWTGSNWEPSEKGWHRHNDGFVLGSPPTVVERGPGYRDVYARGTDGAVYHKFYEDETWSEWFGLGGKVIGSPAVLHPTTSTIDVYVRGTNNAVYQKWWTGSDWQPSPTGWLRLRDHHPIASPLAVIGNAGFRDIYARAPSGEVVHSAWQG